MTEQTAPSLAEQIVSTTAAALPIVGEATIEPAAGAVPNPQALEGIFSYSIPGLPVTLTVGLLTTQGLHEPVASDPATSLAPAVEAGLAAAGGTGTVQVAEATSVASDVKDPVFVVSIDGIPTLAIGIHEGQSFTPARSRVGVDQEVLANVSRIKDVTMDVSVVIGRTTITVSELLRLKPGQVLELDRAAGAPADVLVNGRQIASGEIVVQDLDFAVKITSIRDESDEAATA